MSVRHSSAIFTLYNVVEAQVQNKHKNVLIRIVNF